MGTEDLWNVKEVASFLNVKQSTIYKWFDAGKFGDSAMIISQGPRKRTIRFNSEKVKKQFCQI